MAHGVAKHAAGVDAKAVGNCHLQKHAPHHQPGAAASQCLVETQLVLSELRHQVERAVDGTRKHRWKEAQIEGMVEQRLLARHLAPGHIGHVAHGLQRVDRQACGYHPVQPVEVKPQPAGVQRCQYNGIGRSDKLVEGKRQQHQRQAGCQARLAPLAALGGQQASSVAHARNPQQKHTAQRAPHGIEGQAHCQHEGIAPPPWQYPCHETHTGKKQYELKRIECHVAASLSCTVNALYSFPCRQS